MITVTGMQHKTTWSQLTGQTKVYGVTEEIVKQTKSNLSSNIPSLSSMCTPIIQEPYRPIPLQSGNLHHTSLSIYTSLYRQHIPVHTHQTLYCTLPDTTTQHCHLGYYSMACHTTTPCGLHTHIPLLSFLWFLAV